MTSAQDNVVLHTPTEGAAEIAAVDSVEIALIEGAAEIASAEGTTGVDLASTACIDGVELVRTGKGLALVGDGMEVVADLSRMLPRIKPANLQRELLVKAARVKGLDREPSVVDAMAGFGEDALLLAASGCTVTLYEHNPVIAALLRDALERATGEPQLAPIVARMRLIEGDSIRALRDLASAQGASDLAPTPDVIYLDPMFPERTKSAAVKKKFQLLHRIEIPCPDEHELLEAAFACKPRKIVVKRTLKGPFLADRKPHYSLKGKAVRYDCFALASS